MSQPPDPSSGLPPALDPAGLNTAIASLTPALEILERFHHRNKNQHCSSKWWAQGDMLRRHVRKMLAELESGVAEAEKLARLKAKGKNLKAKAVRAGLEDCEVNGGLKKRAEYLRWKLGPGAYLAFTQLSADRQFAHLGLTLLGVLAQVDKALAPFAPPSPGEGTAAPGRTPTLASATPYQDTDVAMGVDTDMGVAVSRDEMVMLSVEPVEETPTSTPARSTSERRATSLPGRLAGQRDPTGQTRARTPPAAGTEPASNTPAALPEPKEKKKATTSTGKTGDKLDDIFSSLDQGRSSSSTSSNRKKQRKRENAQQGQQQQQPKKKRKKGGDEFDDIFGGLL